MNNSNYNLPNIKSEENSYIDTQGQRKRKYYSGYFSDKDGRPDFKGLGPALKGVLYLFLFSIIISLPEINVYFAILLLLFSIGRILTAIRFNYVETLDQTGEDVYFIEMNELQNFVEGFVALFVLLYMLFGHILAKKNITGKR